MMSQNDKTLQLIISTIVFLVATCILIWIRFFRQQSRRCVLLTGLSDSGKTLIFARLLHSHFVHTHTSIKENIGEYAIGKTPLKIVDVPGHERVRSQLFDKYKNDARGIVFILDSVTIQKEIRDVAEYLYNILSDSVILRNHAHFLILCNKQDQALAKGCHVIKTLLEKEINLLRKTKSSQLQSVDPSHSSTNVFLGKKEKDFDFSQSSIDVEIVECCAIDESNDKPANINYLCQWLTEISY
ncbi:signal recognition particle receptor beta [Arctopsyche grandis]|uniref:signal recognition particle receptor beta n=1 Tax=Arctopsyche grandis TaxID=121162 RepID=UPI00406D8F1B